MSAKFNFAIDCNKFCFLHPIFSTVISPFKLVNGLEYVLYLIYSFAAFIALNCLISKVFVCHQTRYSITCPITTTIQPMVATLLTSIFPTFLAPTALFNRATQ